MLIACLGLGYGSFVLAQSAGGKAPKTTDAKADSAQQQRERAVTRCRENRGVDCDTPEGLKEWIQQERPITDEERTQAVARRRAMEAEERRAREAAERRAREAAERSAPRPGGTSPAPR